MEVIEKVMRAKFTLQNLVEWTEGKLLSGIPDSLVMDISTDTRTIKTGEYFIALEGQNSDGHGFLEKAKAAGATGAIVKGGSILPPSCIQNMSIVEVEDTLTALGKVGKSYKSLLNPKTIGITGCVGKTSTRRFTGTILSQNKKVCESKKNYNNLIGLPLTLLDLAC